MSAIASDSVSETELKREESRPWSGYETSVFIGVRRPSYLRLSLLDHAIFKSVSVDTTTYGIITSENCPMLRQKSVSLICKWNGRTWIIFLFSVVISREWLFKSSFVCPLWLDNFKYFFTFHTSTICTVGISLSIIFQYYRERPLWIPIKWNALFLLINTVMAMIILKVLQALIVK